MEIKKYTFDVLNSDDMNRSFAGCMMRFNDSVIRFSEFFTSDGDLVCAGNKIRGFEQGVELIGREFRLGVNQMRALHDPDNLLPIIRSGHVNIFDPMIGKMIGNYAFARKVGGYVRGYGPKSIQVYACKLDGSEAWYDRRNISDDAKAIRILHSAFIGGHYPSISFAYELIQSYDENHLIALSSNVLMQRRGTDVRVAVASGIGAFTVKKQDDGSLVALIESNVYAPANLRRMYSRIISKVMPCL